MTATIETLTAERRELTEALAMCEPGARPGSKAFWAETAALKALSDFDAAHPEVIAAIKAAHSQRVGPTDPWSL